MKFYDKPSLSIDEQITLLKNRGMAFNNEEKAKTFLSHVHYYRLSPYWKEFESDLINHVFKPETYFETIVCVYEHDRKLRLLLLDAMERIEISFRAQTVNVLSQIFGADFLDNKNLFNDNQLYNNHKQELHHEISKSYHGAIEHFKNTYHNETPPIWISCEIMSFGLLSKIYHNLKFKKIQKKISSVYDLPPEVFESWIHHIVFVRNYCAHHTKIIKKSFKIRPKRLHSPLLTIEGNGDLSDTILVLKYLLRFIADTEAVKAWSNQIDALFQDIHNLLPN